MLPKLIGSGFVCLGQIHGNRFETFVAYSFRLCLSPYVIRHLSSALRPAFTRRRCCGPSVLNAFPYALCSLPLSHQAVASSTISAMSLTAAAGNTVGEHGDAKGTGSSHRTGLHERQQTFHAHSEKVKGAHKCDAHERNFYNLILFHIRFRLGSTLSLP